MEGLVEALGDGADAHAQRRRLLVGQVVGGLDLQVALDDDVLGERAALGLQAVGPVDEAADAVALGKRLGHLGSDLLDDARVVAPHARPHGAFPHADVLPVRRVERHGRGADEYVVIGDGGQGHRLDLGRAGLGDDHGFDLSGGCHDDDCGVGVGCR